MKWWQSPVPPWAERAYVIRSRQLCGVGATVSTIFGSGSLTHYPIFAFIGRWIWFLRQHGRLRSKPPGRLFGCSQLLLRYDDYLNRVAGLTEGTRDDRLRQAREFIRWRFGRDRIRPGSGGAARGCGPVHRTGQRRRPVKTQPDRRPACRSRSKPNCPMVADWSFRSGAAGTRSCSSSAASAMRSCPQCARVVYSSHCLARTRGRASSSCM